MCWGKGQPSEERWPVKEVRGDCVRGEKRSDSFGFDIIIGRVSRREEKGSHK